MALSPRINAIFSSPEKAMPTLFGLFWLIDGILQLQPAMFTSKFVASVISPNLENQPTLIHVLISFGISIFNINMPFENFLFALIQISIGVLLILPISIKVQRLTVWSSIVWSLIIWVFGEGFGNLFTGSASFYTGAPGAALLYLLLAVFLLYPKKYSLPTLPKVAGILFFLGAILQCLPMFWTKDMQVIIYGQMLLHVLISPIVSNAIAVGLLLILGILLFYTSSRLIGYVTLFFLFLVWWISQDFGGIVTFPYGTATDLNSAPLLMLFLLPLFFSKKEKLAK